MWDNLEQAFGELDRNEYQFFAKTLGAYRRALEAEGFSRREAMRLVETYAKFVYDMVIEEIISGKQDYSGEETDSGDDDVDPDDLNGYHN